MSKPSVLIATPAYGGLVTSDYVNCLVDTLFWLAREGYEAQVFTLKNESLIPRGRNQCAWYSLAAGPGGQPFDKLFFIDADMSWTIDEFKRLLESPKRVVGGCYPVKSYPIELAANALHEHYETFGKTRSVEELLALRKKYANEAGEVEVRHVPTGFLKIDTSVLVDLMPYVQSYIGTDVKTNSKQLVRHWDFFPIGPEAPGIDVAYESEDWAFCSRVRKYLAEDVWLNTHVVTRHTGSHTFNAGNV